MLILRVYHGELEGKGSHTVAGSAAEDGSAAEEITALTETAGADIEDPMAAASAVVGSKQPTPSPLTGLAIAPHGARHIPLNRRISTVLRTIAL